MKKVLFICSGNTTRSPMAEYIFRNLLKKNGIEDVVCESCGLDAEEGEAPGSKAVEAALMFDTNISGHRARQIDDGIVEGTDLFVVMERSHEMLLSMDYEVSNKVRVLNISDPSGGDKMAYFYCATKICSALQNLLKDDFFAQSN